jgi:hypothetical protein
MVREHGSGRVPDQQSKDSAQVRLLDDLDEEPSQAIGRQPLIDQWRRRTGLMAADLNTLYSGGSAYRRGAPEVNNDPRFRVTPTLAQVPEPATLALMGLGRPALGPPPGCLSSRKCLGCEILTWLRKGASAPVFVGTIPA